jgi:FkbM family methyltransferase
MKKADVFLRWTARKLRKRLGIAKKARIGRFELLLSPDHLLDEWQHEFPFPLTDAPVCELAAVAAAKYRDFTAVDIGANVGDTAALICHHQDVPVLCIEAHPAFLALLRRNARRLPPGIEIAGYLIGPSSSTIPLARLPRHNGTASLRSDAQVQNGGETISVRPLAEVLQQHPRFSRPHLIKIDTDGADFEIVLSSLDVIRECHPILHFEYHPGIRKDGAVQSLQAIEALHRSGYTQFMVYDNYGYLLETVSQNPVERFTDLNRFVLSHQIFGQRGIHYLDISAFAEKDDDLASALRDRHRAKIDVAINGAGLQT